MVVVDDKVRRDCLIFAGENGIFIGRPTPNVPAIDPPIEDPFYAWRMGGSSPMTHGVTEEDALRWLQERLKTW